MEIKFRFRIKELIAEKETQEGVPCTYKRISRESGIHPDRVRAYVNNDLTRFDAKTIQAFLNFFGCSIYDIFEDLSNSTQSQ